MEIYYKIGGHSLAVSGSTLNATVRSIAGFTLFIDASPTPPEFVFCEGNDSLLPPFKEKLYSFKYEDTDSVFGATDNGYLLKLSSEGETPLYLWVTHKEKKVYLYGNCSPRLTRFALWIGYGIMTAEKDTVAIHSSCIIYRQKAVLFLGESGTGKSTHTRLWREYIKGSRLLNDDSPIVRCEDGQITVYGSPWSGKTPCYKAERYPLAGCIRLSQAPYNKITELATLQAFAALHPSAPPAFAYDVRLYNGICSAMDKILLQIPVYHLGCLPNREAAELACHTLYDRTV